MRRRAGWLVAGAVTLGLTAASVGALAATMGGPVATSTGGPWAASACAPPHLPGATVHVVLSDMGRGTGMMGGGGQMGRMLLLDQPASVPAGPVSLVAVNRGWRTHELVVLPLAAAAQVGERTVRSDDRVSEAGSLGEASRGCGSGAGEGIAPGQTGWVTLTLQPGRYELVCNLPGHYAAGMFAELDVT